MVRSFVCPAACAAAVLMVPVMAAHCQTEPASLLATRVRLTPDDVADFDKVFGALAAQGHIVIVSEGAPLHLKLPKDQLPPASQFASPIPLGKAMVEISALYGYTVAKSGSAFALSKRYEDARDLPDVSLEEMVVSMQAVNRVLSTFNPKMENSRAQMGDFFLALTPEQREELPRRSLRVDTLDTRARDLALSLAEFVYIGPNFTESSDVTYRLAHSARATLSLVNSEESLRQGRQAGGGLLIQLEGEKEMRQFGRLPPSMGDPASEAKTEVNAVVATERDMKVQLAPPTSAQTVNELLPILEAKGPEKFTAAPELATRRAHIFGMNNASASTVFRALAEACGLRVKTGATRKELILARQVSRVPVNIGGIPLAVRQALPDTFLRACGVSRVVTSGKFSPLDASLVGLNGSDKWVAAAAETQPNPFSVSKDWLLQIAAAHHLKAVLGRMLREKRAAPSLALSPENMSKIEVTSLDNKTKSALGAIFLAEFVGRIDQAFPFSPAEYVADFDQDILSGRMRIDSKGQRRLELEFLRPGSDGKSLTFGAGIGSALAPDSLPNFGGAIGGNR